MTTQFGWPCLRSIYQSKEPISNITPKIKKRNCKGNSSIRTRSNSFSNSHFSWRVLQIQTSAMDSSQHNSAAGSIGGNGIINPKSNDASPVDSAANATGSPAEESKQNLNQVINSIDKTLGILHQLYLTVSAYNVSSQFPLLQRM